MRRFSLSVFLTLSLLVQFGSQAAAQLPSTPTRLKVASRSQTLNVNQSTDLRIALLDQNGSEIAAPRDTKLLLYVTKLQDVDSAKRDPATAVLDKGKFYLPAKRNTARLDIVIPRGLSTLTLAFSSEQSGRLRIFAEGEYLVTGVVQVSVIGRVPGKTSAQVMFRPIAFQDDQALAPALLDLSAEGTETPTFDKGAYQRTLTLALNAADGSPARALSDIDVRLKVVGGSASLLLGGKDGRDSIPLNRITIKRGEGQYPQGWDDSPIILRTTVGGPITVNAMAAGFPQKVALFDFPLAPRAARLRVMATPPEALANGLDVIAITVIAEDSASNPIPAAVENLDERVVSFEMEGPQLGLKFQEQGFPIIKIPKNEVGTVVHVLGSCPIPGTQILARSGNISGAAPLTGGCSISFWFPWKQLGFALLGGLIFPLVNSAKRRQQAQGRLPHALLKILREGFVGALIGGVFFGLVFFGAVVVSEIKWGVLPIRLASLPAQSAFGACLIGFLGGVLFGSRAPLRRRLNNAMQRIQAAHSV